MHFFNNLHFFFSLLSIYASMSACIFLRRNPIEPGNKKKNCCFDFVAHIHTPQSLYASIEYLFNAFTNHMHVENECTWSMHHHQWYAENRSQNINKIRSYFFFYLFFTDNLFALSFDFYLFRFSHSFYCHLFLISITTLHTHLNNNRRIPRQRKKKSHKMHC